MQSDFLSHYSDSDIAVLRQVLLNNYERFTKFAFRCQTGNKLSFEPHHKIICEFAQKIIDGKITRGVVTIPPRHSKTAFLTVCLIARSYAGEGQSENIQTSFSENNVKTNASDIIKILSHPTFQRVFPHVKLKSNGQDKFTTSLGGKCHNRTSKGAITGVGAGVASSDAVFSGGLIMDDMIKPSDSRSQTVRDFVNNLYTETLSSRCNTPSTPQLLIMQRLHPEDMVNYVLTGNSGEKWHYLNIPAVLTEDTGSAEWYESICKEYTHAIPYLYKLDIPTLIKRNIEQEWPIVSNSVECEYASYQEYCDAELPVRLKGGRAALWAYRKTLAYYDELERVKKAYFLCQYMGQPSVEGGTVFKKDWFNWYDGFHTLDISQIETMRIYVDSAMKAKAHNDRSVFTAWVKTKQGDIYLVDGLADRWEAPELLEEFKDFYIKMKELKRREDRYRWRLECAKIEDKASGTGLIQNAQRLSGFNIIPIPRSKDKYSRACEVAPELASGKVYLPKGMSISQELIAEAEAFTANDSHKHDDVVDTMMDAIEDLLINTQVKRNYGAYNKMFG